MAIVVTEKAAGEVRRIIQEQQEQGGAPEKIFLRMRVVGGGCSGFQHRLDLDPEVTDRDSVLDVHGVPVVIDKISMVLTEKRAFADWLKEGGGTLDGLTAKLREKIAEIDKKDPEDVANTYAKQHGLV